MKKIILKYDSKIINKKYSKFLKNKKIILVGPAWHTKNTKQVDFINSYDIVVRMNNGSTIPTPKVKEDIGDRIDIWYSSLSLYFFRNKIITTTFLNDLKKRKLKWISCPFFNKRIGGLLRLEKLNRQMIPVHLVNSSYYNILYEQNKKTKITTGLITIYDLLQFKIKELYIMGMSFYRTDIINKRRTYYSGYQKDRIYVTVKGNKHNFHNEFYIFYQLYKKDKRIRCDDVLTKMIKKRDEEVNNAKK